MAKWTEKVSEALPSWMKGEQGPPPPIAGGLAGGIQGYLTAYWVNKAIESIAPLFGEGAAKRPSSPGEWGYMTAAKTTGLNPLTGKADPAVAASAMAQGLLPAEGQSQTITPGRPALGADLTTAAEQEMQAIQSAINYQLELNLGRERTRFGQMGTFMSGTRMEREREMERGAQMDIFNAFARTALEKAQIEQTGTIAGQQMAMQQAQIQAQYDIAGQQRWMDIVGIAAEHLAIPAFKEFAIPWIQNKFGGQQLGSRPGATSAWEGLR